MVASLSMFVQVPAIADPAALAANLRRFFIVITTLWVGGFAANRPVAGPQYVEPNRFLSRANSDQQTH